ncbi:glycosyl transferase family 1 [Pseudalgibacter alginicilyticus]|uniref:Glycosyl transferase family 1 n=1 Tax=Pseudalgibacter alginicilyticus TaxID=1736674 RepID=A0A0N7HYL3_9FLAO|nr:glycosyltransferase family 4 protein [Pseudalgibacter alginicilyticus]ALJ05574.1 glycosyl transferase family 1 [Pseudalgibacter alginicilyticus]
MKIIVLGTRGIPGILGGVETHCEELYPRIAKLEHDVTVITRTPYVKDKTLKSYKGVKLKHIFAPKQKSIEAIIHTFLGVIYAGFKRPDVLHIHAIGPMTMTPLARLLGLKVVVTNHGPDYDRQKWGKLAKSILQLGEYLGTKTAQKVIVISEVIRTILSTKYNRQDSILIYNGVNLPEISCNTDYITSLNLKKDNYIITVGRFVEEKGFSDLIKAYSNITTSYKLVLVGDADHETAYSKGLKKEAVDAGVILTGFIKGEQLRQIFSHARLFVMPSYHEGLPIALLEAMSYNLDVLVSDIPANLEIGLGNNHYFQVGDITALSTALFGALKNTNATINNSKLMHEKYNWNLIAKETIEVYKSIKT